MSTGKKGKEMGKSNTAKKSNTNTTEPRILEPTITAPEVEAPSTGNGERKNEIRMSMVEWDDICKSRGLKTKSAMIRYLWADGYTRSAIAKFLGILYQHVRNVLVQEPKKPSTIAAQNTAASAATTTESSNNAG